MSLLKHKIITAAITLSGLVHGFVLFFVNSDSVSENINSAPVISVHLEIVNDQSLFKAVEQTKVVEKNSQSISEVVSNKAQQAVTQKPEPALHDVEESISAPQLASATAQSETVIEKINSDNNVRQLLTLVYQEVNRHKRYPYIARKQGREGLVKLNFILHPDGRVTDVAIVESSRFTVLDRAAQKAVEDISPFLMAAEYLSYQQSFDVNLDFRLSKI